MLNLPSPTRKDALTRRLTGANRPDGQSNHGDIINKRMQDRIEAKKYDPQDDEMLQSRNDLDEILRGIFGGLDKSHANNGAFNPEAQIDQSQIEDRSSFILQNLLNQLTYEGTKFAYPDDIIFPPGTPPPSWLYKRLKGES
jgi:hypothetical protein